MKDYIDAAAFKEMVLCADAAVRANMQAVNDLNVFPVPDGDTGTNMSLTLANAVVELNKKNPDTVGAAASTAASGLLRGARGNSGVILSLLFRGISKRLKTLVTAGPAEFASAMNDGVEAAYKAVMKPAEGTVLTVSRLAAAGAVECAKKGGSLEDVFCAAIASGNEALENTVNQNPVLKKAGVIDAGGKGYMLILEAMYQSLKGEFVYPEETVSAAAQPEEENVYAKFTDEDITFAFDTVYIVRKHDPDVDLEPLRAFLTSIGDCLVIGEDDESFKVHVHTDTPGVALTESQRYGTLELAKIENMRTQHDDLLAGRKAQTTDDLDAIEAELEAMESAQEQEDVEAEPEKDYGIVAVCAGDGMANLFRELGADAVVTGGQTMNPSTDDILKAVKKTPASTVFVFPNNKNIIMAAEQCAALTEKKVVVMPTKTVPQGISALLNFSPDVAEEELVATMNGAAANVHTAMVTYAARDSEFDGYSIREGEYLALLDGALAGSFTELDKLFAALSEKMNALNPEFITVYYGENVTAEAAEEVAGMISSCIPDAETSVVNGGQPVYYYMISVE